MTALAFTVPGEVRGKGRPRIIRIAGHARLKADEKTATYENLVALACREAMGALDPFEGPVCVTISARFMPPASASRRVRGEMLSGNLPPAKRPDLDNICKVVDALNGIAWRDDAQIVSLFARKVYSETPGLDVCIRPFLPAIAQQVAA